MVAIKRVKNIASSSKRNACREKSSCVDNNDERWPEDLARNITKRITKVLEEQNASSSSSSQRLHPNPVALVQRSEIQLGKKLGSGTFSNVYEMDALHLKGSNRWTRRKGLRREAEYLARTVQDKDGQARYAIKHIKASLVRRNPVSFCRAAADLVAEARMLSCLDHAHIVKIHGWSMGGVDAYARDGRHDGYFLILDRLHGGTLQDKIDVVWRRDLTSSSSLEQQLVSIMEKTRIATQLASALAYLHEHDILYRDLKPENVGFDANGNVQLFDLGLAREIPRSTTKNTMENEVFEMSGKVGTLRYMAPECANCQEYNLKADVFSWAMVFYEMMTLQKPFAELRLSDYQEWVHKQGQRPNLLGWPILLRDLVETCWSQTIRDRPTMKDVQSRLAGAISADLDLQLKEVRATTEKKNMQPPHKEYKVLASIPPRDREQQVEQNNSSNGTFATTSISSDFGCD